MTFALSPSNWNLTRQMISSFELWVLDWDKLFFLRKMSELKKEWMESARKHQVNVMGEVGELKWMNEVDQFHIRLAQFMHEASDVERTALEAKLWLINTQAEHFGSEHMRKSETPEEKQKISEMLKMHWTIPELLLDTNMAMLTELKKARLS